MDTKTISLLYNFLCVSVIFLFIFICILTSKCSKAFEWPCDDECSSSCNRPDSRAKVVYCYNPKRKYPCLKSDDISCPCTSCQFIQEELSPNDDCYCSCNCSDCFIKPSSKTIKLRNNPCQSICKRTCCCKDKYTSTSNFTYFKPQTFSRQRNINACPCKDACTCTSAENCLFNFLDKAHCEIEINSIRQPEDKTSTYRKDNDYSLSSALMKNVTYATTDDTISEESSYDYMSGDNNYKNKYYSPGSRHDSYRSYEESDSTAKEIKAIRKNVHEKVSLAMKKRDNPKLCFQGSLRFKSPDDKYMFRCTTPEEPNVDRIHKFTIGVKENPCGCCSSLLGSKESKYFINMKVY